MRCRLPSVAVVMVTAMMAVATAQEKNDKGGNMKNYYYEKEKTSIFAMEYVPIGHLRTDPVVTQTCLSDHVHTFYGPPKLHPSVTYEDLRSSDETFHRTSGNLLENQSLYWHPSFYRVEEGGSKTLVEPDWVTVYYAYEQGGTQSFPEGFRMLTHPASGLDLTCYKYTSEGNGKTVYDNKESNQQKDSMKEGYQGGSCQEMAASIVFPTCWDGTTLGTEGDPVSHMSYGIGLEGGKLESFGYSNVVCPESHPIKLPQILLFLRFADYEGSRYILSNGDGSDWHADYIMGWEESFLQGILDGCGVQKDIPCGGTRLRNIFGTASGEPHSWNAMAETLRKNAPRANTRCVTDEAVTQVEVIPRGECQGEVLSDACDQYVLTLEENNTYNPSLVTCLFITLFTAALFAWHSV